MLLEYFTKGTEGTITGGQIGMEIETDFVFKDGTPITVEIAKELLSNNQGRPSCCQQKLELGRQKIELVIAPQPNASLLMEAAAESFFWLCRWAWWRYGATPLCEPEIQWQGELLWVQEERDEIWVQLDGRPALEHLCRCSSVQFTVDVNPADACRVINRLWEAQLHLRDYAPNERRWHAYVAQSKANYRPDRYGGPAGFNDLQEYVAELTRHDVVMHQGHPVRLNVEQVPDLNVDLFLRSVWWHYRLRRYGNTLALEMRPFARRCHNDIPALWELIAETIGLYL